VKTSQPQKVFDQYLVIRAAAGSPEAFEKLARDWTPRLVRFASGILGRADAARDAVQETWLAAVGGIRKLEDPASFPGWIYGIARRKCIDAIRVNQRRHRLSERVRREGLAQQEVGTVNTDVGGDAALAAALSRLNDDQREVVILYYGEELSLDDIALVIDVPVGTVKSRLFHARAALKNLLGESK